MTARLNHTFPPKYHLLNLDFTSRFFFFQFKFQSTAGICASFSNYTCYFLLNQLICIWYYITTQEFRYLLHEWRKLTAHKSPRCHALWNPFQYSRQQSCKLAKALCTGISALKISPFHWELMLRLTIWEILFVDFNCSTHLCLNLNNQNYHWASDNCNKIWAMCVQVNSCRIQKGKKETFFFKSLTIKSFSTEQK